MKKNNIKAVLMSLFMVSVLCLPFLVFAQAVKSDTGILDRVKTVGDSGGFSSTSEESLARNLGLLVRTIMSFLGIIFIILTIVAGFKWMTASGNEKQVEDAKKNITNAVIGLVITISSYAIWRLVEVYIINRSNG